VSKLKKKINALRFSPRGVYLYDKGENDELFYVIVVATTDLQVYFNIFLKKSKEFFQKNFSHPKNNIYAQKMIKSNIFTRFVANFVES
jgi:hypothetical protein